MRVGEFYLKYLKRGCNRTKGRGHKDFKKEGKLGQGVDALKKGGAGITLRTMSLILVNSAKSELYQEMISG